VARKLSFGEVGTLDTLPLMMNTDLIWKKFIDEKDDLSFSIVYDTYVEVLYAHGIHLGFRDELCKDAIQDVFYNIFINVSSG
jgi:hypothetical protein